MMDKTEKKKLCNGCHYDYYNGTGAEECWHLANAQRVERTRIGVWQNPPYKWAPQQTLNCHAPDGTVWIDQDDPRITVDAE